MLFRSCGRAPGARRERLRSAAVAALVSALGVLLIAIMAGGSAGGGRYESITVHPLMLALATFGWLLAPAALVALLFPAGEMAVDEVRVAPPRKATEVAVDDELEDAETAETAEDAGDVEPEADPDAADDSAPLEDPDVSTGPEADGDAAEFEDELDAVDPADELDEVDPEDELVDAEPGEELDPDEAEWADLIRRVQQADTTGDPRN